MARFFVDELPVEGSQYTLTGENAAHARVLRLKPGEEVTLCNGRGTDCPCTVVEGLTLRVGASLPCPADHIRGAATLNTLSIRTIKKSDRRDSNPRATISQTRIKKGGAGIPFQFLNQNLNQLLIHTMNIQILRNTSSTSNL